jgi:lipopolysaccharide biosynthesis regulator YciM
MRVRTYLGLLLSVVLIVSASYLTHQNRDLLYEPFRLGAQTAVPLYLVLLAVFLAGFLPTVTVLLVQTLKRDLGLRRERRQRREARSLRASFRRAVDHRADGQWARALAELETVLADQPEDFDALLHYGEALRHLGRVDEAVEVHRRASAAFPQSVAILYQLAEDYEARGDAEVAEEIRARVLREAPGFGLAIFRRRRSAALGAGDFPEAERLQERVEALLRDAGDERGLQAESAIGQGLAYQRGVRLLEEDQVEEAVLVFREILAREPRFVPAAIMLGEAALLRGDDAAALDEWRRGYLSTGSPVFLQRIEDHFIESEHPAEAIETLRGLIAQAANDLLPRFFLGRLYYRLEMHEEALRVLASVGERIHSSPTYHYLLARIHERRGEMRRAVESYLTCVRQLGITTADYVCRVCRRQYEEWSDRCVGCGSWNAVEMDFEEERLSAEELGVRQVPVWRDDLDSGEWSLSAAEER